MFTIGLTGGIGSGKSTVSEIFKALGAGIVDTDVIAHQLTAPNGIAIPLIKKTFGEKYLTKNQSLDREKMRKLIFSDKKAKRQLEHILHPLIRQEALRLKSICQAPYVIMVVPLLIESAHWLKQVDRVLVVDCTESTQIQRIKQRNHLHENDIKAIIRHQIPRIERLKYANDIINNDNNSLDALSIQIRQLHQNYLKSR